MKSFPELKARAESVVLSCETIPQYKAALEYVRLVADRCLEAEVILSKKIPIIRWGGFMHGFLSAVIIEMEHAAKMPENERLP